jgi:twinkle protein
VHTTSSQTSNLYHLPCPSCTSSDAYSQYADGHGYCFSCNKYFKGDTLTNDDGTDFTYEFLGRRGIASETFRHFKCPTKVDRVGKPVSVGFRYPNGSVKVRLLDDKKTTYWSLQHAKPEAGLFGMDLFAPGSHKFVTITEGEYDALSLFQLTRSPVVSVRSASTARSDATAARSWLNGFERIYLALDDDAPGREAAREIARLFDYNKVYLVQFGERKDANAFLQLGLDADLRNLWLNAQRFGMHLFPVISSVNEFEKIVRQEPEWGVPYPACLRQLNDMTYGIRRGETVLFTAQEGVGKTEVMHAIEHQLLKETDHALAAIYLEEPKQRHLQALAGLELRRPAHLPDSGCTSDQIVAALKGIVTSDEKLYLYSHFGSDDPEVLLDTIRFLVTSCNVHYVIVDHITMGVSGLAGEDERRALDYLATRLEMMVKELNYALLVVSHVNDEGKTRGSRYIGKVADIRVDLSRDLLNPDPVTRNTTQIVVAKNRYCGKTGPAGTILFDPVTYTYQEPANDNINGYLDSTQFTSRSSGWGIPAGEKVAA